MATKTLILEFDGDLVSAESDNQLTTSEVLSAVSLLQQVLLRSNGMGLDEIQEAVMDDMRHHKISKG